MEKFYKCLNEKCDIGDCMLVRGTFLTKKRVKEINKEGCGSGYTPDLKEFKKHK